MPKMPYSMLILTIFSLVFGAASVANFYDLSPITFGLVALCAFMAVGGDAVRRGMVHRSGQRFVATWIRANSLLELGGCLFLWLVGLAIILIPLGLAYQKDAIIVGVGDCDDGMIHSLWARGLSFCRTFLPSNHCESAPLGAQSFMYYVNSIFVGQESHRIVLSASLCCYSLMMFWADSFTRLFSTPKFYKPFISILAICSFVVTTSAYIGFVSQTAAMPFTLATMTILVSSSAFGSLRDKAAVCISLAIGAIVSYTLFSVTVLISCAVAVIAAEVCEHRSARALWRKFLDIVSCARSWYAVVFLIAVCVMLWPPVRACLVVLGLEIAAPPGTGGKAVTAAVGNLDRGALSILHLTGLWPSDLDYRDLPTRQTSAAFAQLGVLLVAQLWLVASTEGVRRARTLLLGLFLLYACACTLLSGPYVQFKYLAYLTPMFLVSVGLAYGTRVELLSTRLGRWAGPLFLVVAVIPLAVYIHRAVLTPLKRVARTNIISAERFALLESAAAEVDNKRGLILTTDPWLHAFVGQDDVLPMTNYFGHKVTDEPIDILIRDRFVGVRSLDDKVAEFPHLLELGRKEQCRIKVLGERFDVYDARCGK